MNGKRLKQSRKNKNMTAQQLADIVGVTRVTVARWENGTFEPDDKTKKALASILGVSVAYLMDETEEAQHAENEKEFPILQLHDDNIVRIKVIPMEAVASLDEATQINDVVFKEGNLIYDIFVNKKYLTAFSGTGELFGVQICDNSMQGAQMKKGQIAIVERTTQVLSGCAMLITYSGHSFFRWLIARPDGIVELRPANPDFKSEFTTPQNAENFRVIGQVVGVVNMPHTPQKAF